MKRATNSYVRTKGVQMYYPQIQSLKHANVLLGQIFTAMIVIMIFAIIHRIQINAKIKTVDIQNADVPPHKHIHVRILTVSYGIQIF